MHVLRLTLLTLLTIVGLVSTKALAGDADREAAHAARLRIGEIERKVADGADMARRSVVRIAWGKEEREGGCSGVIVDAEGHVATSGRELLNVGTPVVFYLADGRRASGKVLGASWELGVGLAPNGASA